MGFHAYLQKNNTPFESAMANQMNLEMFEYIKSNADITTRELAIERGACPDDDTCFCEKCTFTCNRTKC